jgi:hypothetical protein
MIFVGAKDFFLLVVHKEQVPLEIEQRAHGYEAPVEIDLYRRFSLDFH